MTVDATPIGELLRTQGARLVTAESCTGGWIAKACTDLAGSSDWFECGYVTYSNEAKRRDLGVALGTLEHHGAVSEAVVREMAEGALRHSGAQVAVATSGIAGPGGAVPGKPVGTVWFAVSLKIKNQTETLAEVRLFEGDREAVRRASVQYALEFVYRSVASRLLDTA